MNFPFFKKHKTQERFWDYKTRTWVKQFPKGAVLINWQGYNIHPSHQKPEWYCKEAK